MATIKPFKGMRFNTEKAGEISTLCCPPYDIISEAQRKEFIAENEYNVIRLELPKEGEDVYKTAARVLETWRESGVLVYEDKPAIYIYEEEFFAHNKCKSIKGIIARVKLEEFSKGVILPHEFTLSKAKEDRFNLMKATNCNFSQIYALYMDGRHKALRAIERLSADKPELEFTDNDKVTHRLWVVTDEAEISELVADFSDKRLYIADGHHRYETALNYRNYCRENGISAEGDGHDYQMMYLMDMEHSGLVVFPTHRMIRSLPDFNKNRVLDGCKELFDITKFNSAENIEAELEKQYKQRKKAFGFYCGQGEWYMLVLKKLDVMDEVLPDVSTASRSLDVSVLHTLVLEKILGIDKENMAKQINLTYTKTIDEAVGEVDCGEFQCSFILNPTRVTEIRDVAAAGEKMPQKSTYFYPKMITGFVMNDLEVFEMLDRKMRRISLQTDEQTARQILLEGSFGVLSTVGEDGFPYGIPVNYAYDGEKIYFHCAKSSGHKQENLSFCNKVCFTAVTEGVVLPEQLDTKYKSVVVFGLAEKTESNKEYGLKLISQKYAHSFAEKIESEIKSECKNADVYEITPLKISGKQKHQ